MSSFATDSMTTSQRQTFSKFFYAPPIRIRTQRPFTATASSRASAIKLTPRHRSKETHSIGWFSTSNVPLLAVPLRGLIRRDAIRKAGPVRRDEFRAAHQVHVWLAKLLHWGNFKRVAKPLYYRLDHPRSFSNEYSSSSDDRKRASMTTLFTGLLEAAMPLCRTPEERQFFQQAIVDQLVAWPTRNEPSSTAQFMDQCLERLRFEGNTQLFPEEELPPVLQEFQLRLNESKLSRMQRMIYRIRRRARMGRLIYPRSHMRRILYQIRHLAGLKLGRLLGDV